MTILHLDTGREMRGGQHQVRLLMKGLQAEGHACILLARRGGALAKRAVEDGFAVFPAQLRELWRRSQTVDVVHAHDARAHLLAALTSQKPFVVSRRVGFPIQTTLLSRWKYKRARRYLAVSQFVAERLFRAGIPPHRVDIVFDAVAALPNLGPWDRRHPVVAPAFRDDPKKLSQMTEEACRLAGVKLRLSRDLEHDLTRASSFLYLTESEGLGSAALLAMAYGVPVIASKVEGLGEVFEDNCSGIYVANNATAAAQALRRVMDEPGLADRLREAARARISDFFSIPSLVDGTLKSYERALAG